jgi:hypothetical protein
LFNVGTILTLILATAVAYVVLFAGTVLAAALLIDTSVLEQSLQRPVDVTDYLTLAWIISSLATVGGAIGSGWRTRNGAGRRLRLPSRTGRLAGRKARVAHRGGVGGASHSLGSKSARKAAPTRVSPSAGPFTTRLRAAT